MTVALSLAPTASAAIHHVYPDRSIGGAVSSASPGDTIIVHEGTYPKQVITKAFSSTVTIQEAAGETATVAGFEFLGASYLKLDGVRIAPDSRSVPGVRIANKAHDITVANSDLVGGQFNVRVYGHGSNASSDAKPSSYWP